MAESIELKASFEELFGPDSAETLTAQSQALFWATEAGNRHQELNVFQQLLTDRERILGPDHPDTLTTRSNIAYRTGDTGNPHQALNLFQQLLTDQQRILGPDHPDTLITRINIAGWTGDTGNPHQALNLFEQLLTDQQRILGPDHPSSRATERRLRVSGKSASFRRAVDKVLQTKSETPLLELPAELRPLAEEMLRSEEDHASSADHQ